MARRTKFRQKTRDSSGWIPQRGGEIKDALKFYQALGTEVFAQSRLDDIIDSAARDLVTAQLLIEVVRDSNRVLKPGSGSP